ncbi:MAG: hypothetical protein MUP13_11020, partial [Thermoanaerobaculales bacterium]|nr:hypothetical protein [Thermoanaerobaculales bacterium]
MPMLDAAQDLLTGFASAYSAYVEERIAEQALERPSSLDGALAEGEAWLAVTLEAVLALPFDQQERGPLEVFQEAMRFPTGVLAAAGVQKVGRDPGAVAALPGDVYNLAPASSRQLGEGAWKAHLAWGAAKAGAHLRFRSVGLLSANLMDRSRIEPLVERSGAKLVVWDAWNEGPDGRAGDWPGLVLADLSVRDSIVAIAVLAQAGVRVVA